MTEQPTTERKYETIKVRITDKARLDTLKELEGRSILEIVSRAIDAYLELRATQ